MEILIDVLMMYRWLALMCVGLMLWIGIMTLGYGVYLSLALKGLPFRFRMMVIWACVVSYAQWSVDEWRDVSAIGRGER